MRIAMTGGTGTIGMAVIPKLMENRSNSLCLLIRDSKTNRKKIKKLKKTYGNRIRFLSGDVRDIECCSALVKGADYVLHLAGVIPPKSDHDAKLTWEINYGGTVNVINAIIENGNTAKLVIFSSVATYGHRCEPHLWGRVGDPLMPSVFDSYGASKMRAERYLLESRLETWVILRVGGVLYDNLLMNNIGDGLIFHTPVNIAIEWVFAGDLGRLLSGIVSEGDHKEAFWNHVYNVGGGESCRESGFETYEDGFRLIGGSAKKIFEPHWHLQRNFHCFWFSDSRIPEEFFHYQTESCRSFWNKFAARHKIYRLGRLLPPGLIKTLFLKPILKTPNAPLHWVESGDLARVTAFYESMEAYQSLPRTWDQVDLLCERSDYAEQKTWTPEKNLSHGYDETKPDEALDLSDMEAAAKFRGGKVLSKEMIPGDLRTKLFWQCHNGHIFESSPYTILKTGHWCPVCCSPEYEWNYDALSRHIPFYAQVWYDSHKKEEDNVYLMEESLTCRIEKR